MDKLTVIKIGGRLLESDAGLLEIAKSISAIEGKKIIVHGAGVMITELCNRLGYPVTFVNGRRVTSTDTLKAVLMSCAGDTNKRLVTALNSCSSTSIGLTGADGELIRSKKRNSEPIDFGLVGDIESVNSELLNNLLHIGLIPVIASVTQGETYELLNTNADTVASSIATNMANYYLVSLIYFMDKGGVLLDTDDEKSLINQLSFANYENLKSKGVVHSGMLPKLENGFLALKQGVQTVAIGLNEKSGTQLVIK